MGAEVAVVAGRGVVGVDAPRGRVATVVAAGLAVVAGGAIGVGGVGAHAARRVAGAGDVALIGIGASDRVAARADPCLAGVRQRTRIAVVAGGTIGLGGVRAHAG